MAAVTVEPELHARLVGSVAEADARRLQRRFNGVEMSRIAEVEDRRPARFGGEVRSQQRSAPGTSTGSAVAVFTGRSRIFGIEAGRPILFEGVARRERGQLIVYNPAYTLLP